MSMLSPQLRRLPRLAESAAVRARLSLVPRPARGARRMPFAVLVFTLLAGGVVGLLMFNTQMQQSAFYATSLQQEATSLAAHQQTLQMQLQQLRDPQSLAVRAKRLGMVVPSAPAFLELPQGKVLGAPAVATPLDRMRVRGYPASRPADLAPKARVVHVIAPVTPKASVKSAATSQASSGAASPNATAGRDRKNPVKPQQQKQQTHQH